MNHDDVIRRAIADRLAQYEGSSAGQGREAFLNDVTAMILTMIAFGSPEAVLEGQKIGLYQEPGLFPVQRVVYDP